MKVLVTGGAGFIGSHIVDGLIGQGYEVIVIDNLSTGNLNNVNSNAKFYQEDIRSSRIIDLFKSEKPEYVFHEAAQTDIQVSLKNPTLDADVNILGTVNVLQACVQSGVKKIIYASSAAVYGNPHYLGIDETHPVSPMSPYGISKQTPEHYFYIFNSIYGIEFTILRYANVFGIRQDLKGEGGVVSIFLDKLLRGESPWIFGDGDQTRDFIYVKDVANANLAAINRGHQEVVNIGTGIQTSVNGIFRIIKELINNKISPEYEPMRPGEIMHSYFNIAKAKDILCWTPQFCLQKGLEETVEYYKELYYAQREVAAADSNTHHFKEQGWT